MTKTSRRNFMRMAGAGAVIAANHSPRLFAQSALGDTAIRIGIGDEMTSSINATAHKALAQLFEKQLTDNLHPGAQLTVMHDDKLVFDRWGGAAIKPTTPVEHDTKMLLFSSTKPLGGTCAMMLVESGDLELDKPVAYYWPAFAKSDPKKSAVTVRHVLGHQAGLPTGPKDFQYEHFNDPAAAMHAMERAELLWEPGSKFVYHPLNYGWLTGELIRRVSGMPVDRFMKEHLFEPLGCVNASLGVPADELDEISFLYKMDEPDHAIEIWNSPTVRMATCCASNGHMPASDLARFYQMMSRGGVTDSGQQLLKSETIDQMTTNQPVEKTGKASGYGLGFFIGSTGGGENVGENNFGHGGYHTSFGFCEPDLNLVAAWITNGHPDRESHSERMGAIADAIRALA